MARSAPNPRLWGQRALSLALAFVLLLTPACSGSGGGKQSNRQGAQQRNRPAPVADQRPVRVSDLTQAEMAQLEADWRLFVRRDERWAAAFDPWLQRGGPAIYILSENFFRYFWSASRLNKRAEVGRVAMEVKKIGEPAVAMYVKALVTDRWPLKEPKTVEVFNPDNINEPFQKTFTHYDIDDMTRQHASYVLASIGPPAVPQLTSPRVMQSSLASARRYGAYALGAIATDAAVAALGHMVVSGCTWQDRGAAAKGLGFALRKNQGARPHLQRALQDPDKFVRKKAQEGLDGKTKIEF